MEERRLTAILFSDISGYTSMMGENEEKAYILLEKNRRIHKALVKSFHGRIIDEIGDGTFACFNSALDAVQCAIELNRVCQEDPALRLHIGIHLAEVVFSGNNAYGDGVNLTSRIQASAEKDEILISEDVYRNIRNHEGILAEFIGDRLFKNVKEKIGIYKLQINDSYKPITNPQEILKKVFGLKENAGVLSKERILKYGILFIIILVSAWAIYNVSHRSPPDHIEKSIAVLPFKNFSGDKDYDYFSDGMTEEVINYLSKIADLKVISRTSVEQYKNSDKDTPDIARELGVSNILEGSVRKDSNKVRITVQLIQARTRFHLWSDEYDRSLSGVIKVQSDIAKEVAGVLAVVLTDKEKTLLDVTTRVELTAYDFYMQAQREKMNYLINNEARSLNTAINLYRKTLMLDSNFAPAFAGLGWANSRMQNLNQYLSENYLDSTFIFAEKALLRDQNCEEAHYLLGYYYFQHGESDKALMELDRALEINPNYPEALWMKADILCYTKRNYVEGIKLCLQTIQLNHGPQFVSMLTYIGNAYLEIGIFDKAEKFFIQAINLTGDSSNYLYLKSYKERSLGNYDAALSYLPAMCKSNSKSSRCIDQEAWCYTLQGKYEKALNVWLNSDDPSINLNNQHRIGYLYYKLGNKEKAMEYMNRQKENCEASLRLGREYSQSFRAQYDLAGVYSFFGDKKNTYYNLELVRDKIIPPFWLMVLIKSDPLFENIREEEHFKQIIETMKNKMNSEREKVLQLTTDENNIIS